MFGKLLVPLDGSSFGEQALPLAASLARRAGATVEVVHVHSPTDFYPAPSAVAPHIDERVRQDRRTYLDTIVERLGSLARVRAAPTLLIGQPADALTEHAATQGVDLVVMSTHGRGPLSRFWLGSVADHLVRRLSVPLLLVRPTETPVDLSVDVGLQRILIPLDGSELSEGILPTAVALGKLMQASFTLMRVVDPTAVTGANVPGFTMSSSGHPLLAELQAAQDEQKSEAQVYLERVAGRLRSQAPGVEVRVISSREPAAAILEEAQAERCDLIALETRGRGGLVRLLLGSVADKVVRGAMIPVLVHHPQSR